jgi:hypothetical protein
LLVLRNSLNIDISLISDFQMDKPYEEEKKWSLVFSQLINPMHVVFGYLGAEEVELLTM